MVTSGPVMIDIYLQQKTIVIPSVNVLDSVSVLVLFIHSTWREEGYLWSPPLFIIKAVIDKF